MPQIPIEPNLLRSVDHLTIFLLTEFGSPYGVAVEVPPEGDIFLPPDEPPAPQPPLPVGWSPPPMGDERNSLLGVTCNEDEDEEGPGGPVGIRLFPEEPMPPPKPQLPPDGLLLNPPGALADGPPAAPGLPGPPPVPDRVSKIFWKSQGWLKPEALDRFLSEPMAVAVGLDVRGEFQRLAMPLVGPGGGGTFTLEGPPGTTGGATGGGTLGGNI